MHGVYDSYILCSEMGNYTRWCLMPITYADSPMSCLKESTPKNNEGGGRTKAKAVHCSGWVLPNTPGFQPIPVTPKM